MDVEDHEVPAEDQRLDDGLPNQTEERSLQTPSSAPSIVIHRNETKDENKDPVTSITDRKTTSHDHRATKAATVTSWGYDWLCFETEKEYVTTVWCKICRERYQDRCPESSTSTPSALHPGQVQLCDLDAYITGTINIKKTLQKANSHQKVTLQHSTPWPP